MFFDVFFELFYIILIVNGIFFCCYCNLLCNGDAAVCVMVDLSFIPICNGGAALALG